MRIGLARHFVDFFVCGSFLLFMFRIFHAVLSVHLSLVVACWETANLLVLMFVMFSHAFVTFPCRFEGQVWYLIVAIPDRRLLPYSTYMLSWLKSLFILAAGGSHSTFFQNESDP